MDTFKLDKGFTGKVEYGDAWNFGPSDEGSTTVEDVVKNVKDHWNNFEYEFNKDLNQPHEARLLKLDCAKANKLFGERYGIAKNF